MSFVMIDLSPPEAVLWLEVTITKVFPHADPRKSEGLREIACYGVPSGNIMVDIL